VALRAKAWRVDDDGVVFADQALRCLEGVVGGVFDDGTPPSAFSRAAKRTIVLCGSASMMAARRPLSCQWTARQLASVLLPLPPFMVATVMIECAM
jgi:hypothetical protein